ncbi:FIG138056: a glutathione-dependent thiol reductase [hydrothermal vent metagenome]|uniref:FIG138056: a glutathione-dependent thiol reductase n=1 Tax=hydrothermal vent metagenome TaxID=652676 RepID=A0A3B1A175_9ZZZZ
MITLYGIKTCDAVKKARRWLDNNQQKYQFHDFRVDGVDSKKLSSWLAQIDNMTLLNKRSTTWRQLSDTDKSNLSDSNIKKLLINNVTLIKRPVLEVNNKIYTGFSDKHYQEIFN